MIISPTMVLKLLCFSFAYGIVIGALNDINKIVIIIFGGICDCNEKNIFNKRLHLKRKNVVLEGLKGLINLISFVQDIFIVLIYSGYLET